ncbi:methyltransferase domain-containing protein [Mycobacterium celatum]|uniref:Methyltransferase domain-containing protein n=1 Tax=Mycobacterium celatum TaxID=28045 RepID=A0A2G5PRF3_MYCCE|nr:methyltransferase domain-containing protein [Mycobacterium celatum]
MSRSGIALPQRPISPQRQPSPRFASPGGEGVRGFTAELADYRGDVYRDLPARLQSGERGPYLKEYDEVVAQGSRLVEPFIARFVRRLVEDRPARTMLEIGCGTGIYVRHAVQACPQLSAVAIDLPERVVALASANFAAWGLADRCTVLHADIRDSNLAEARRPVRAGHPAQQHLLFLAGGAAHLACGSATAPRANRPAGIDLDVRRKIPVCSRIGPCLACHCRLLAAATTHRRRRRAHRRRLPRRLVPPAARHRSAVRRRRRALAASRGPDASGRPAPRRATRDRPARSPASRRRSRRGRCRPCLR